MRELIKQFSQKILGARLYMFLVNKFIYLRNLRSLVSNFYFDGKLYYKHSNVFKKAGLQKEEAQLILDYHSIEKGMLYLNMKPKFAKKRVLRLLKTLESNELLKNIDRSQVKVTLQVLCKYYELHKKSSIDIEEYFPSREYDKFRDILNEDYSEGFCGAIDYTYDRLYSNVEKSFSEFAFSRKSVRDFTGELVSHQLIERAMELSLSSPSVCNRQANKVYLIEDKVKIDQILKIQGGFRGYTDNVNQILILTNNRNYYYTVGERNQLYIDGGVFLMNLLYSLYYYKIASCPINWGKVKNDEVKLDSVIKIPESEKIICIIPIGKAKENFRVTLSKRRDIGEIFAKL